MATSSDDRGRKDRILYWISSGSRCTDGMDALAGAVNTRVILTSGSRKWCSGSEALRMMDLNVLVRVSQGGMRDVLELRHFPVLPLVSHGTSNRELPRSSPVKKTLRLLPCSAFGTTSRACGLGSPPHLGNSSLIPLRCGCSSGTRLLLHFCGETLNMRN